MICAFVWVLCTFSAVLSFPLLESSTVELFLINRMHEWYPRTVVPNESRDFYTQL